MESHLNEAHQQQRKAENLLKSGRFVEAIECHEKAANLLQESMKQTTVDKALESLQLQYDYHIRQQAIVSYRQKHVEKLRRAIQKKKLEANHDSEETVAPSTDVRAEELQDAIYRTMEENDSLLQFLIKNKKDPDSDRSSEGQTPTENGKTTDDIAQSGIKMPKSDQLLIEELQMNNADLRRFIQQLLMELDKTTQENKVLQQKLADLQLYEGASTNKAHLKVITDSSSPFVISPCSELSPVGLRDLPPLAPLEMPTFEFNLLKSDTSDNSEN